MKRLQTLVCRLFLAVFFLATQSWGASLPINSVEFVSKTNVSAVQVKGKTEAPIVATITLKGQEISALESSLPPQNLKTGLDLRDQHMVERVFTASDKSVPAMVFKMTSPFVLDGTEKVLNGTLSIRGQEKAFTPRCTGSLSGAAPSQQIKMRCAGSVDLTHYAIEIPSHMGVKVKPLVEVLLITEGQVQP